MYIYVLYKHYHFFYLISIQPELAYLRQIYLYIYILPQVGCVWAKNLRLNTLQRLQATANSHVRSAPASKEITVVYQQVSIENKKSIGALLAESVFYCITSVTLRFRKV